MNALVYVDIDQGIHKVKLKVVQNEKGKKTTWIVFLHKHSKLWKVSIGKKVERKTLFSEEWYYRFRQ